MGPQGLKGEPGGIAFMRSGTFVMTNSARSTVEFSAPLPIDDFAVVVNVVQDQNGITGSPQPFYFSIEDRTPGGFTVVMREAKDGRETAVQGSTTFYYLALPYQ